MQNDDLDSSLQPLVDKLRELPESDPRAVKRVLARLRQADSLPNAQRRALRRHFAERAGWWAAAAVLVLSAGITYAARSDRSTNESEVALVQAEAPNITDAPADDASVADRLVSRRFVIESTQARQVALVGDFNQWNPQQHRLHRDGRTARWYITVRLSAGLHKYAFIVNDSV